MRNSASNSTHRIRKTNAKTEFFATKDVAASRLRRRKYALVRKFGFPEDLLGGALTLSYRRCGKPTCHCASTQGHPQWVLTYSVEGKRRVQALPADLLEGLRPFAERGREYKDAVAALLAINAQLVTLFCNSRRAKAKRRTAR
jgi:hypothetical protein